MLMHVAALVVSTARVEMHEDLPLWLWLLIAAAAVAAFGVWRLRR